MATAGQNPELLSQEIIRYYDQGKEATRLTGGIGSLELARTKELIGRFAPKPPAVIAEIGGGPGTYACWLARKGYEVHLVDAIALHVEQARQASLKQPDRPLASCTQGDARQLEFDDNWADIALLLGPLYHLVENKERLAALRECRRILRPA